MSQRRELTFGERTVSWLTVWDELTPARDLGDDEPPHDDDGAYNMHKLRGMVMTQAAETEAVLGNILSRIKPGARLDRPARKLLADIRTQLPLVDGPDLQPWLSCIKHAIDRRNHAVHSPVTIGSSWVPYATGGGEWTPVISLMGTEAYDETDLLDDLALQQEATIAAVQILLVLEQANSTEPENIDAAPSAT